MTISLILIRPEFIVQHFEGLLMAKMTANFGQGHRLRSNVLKIALLVYLMLFEALTSYLVPIYNTISVSKNSGYGDLDRLWK